MHSALALRLIGQLQSVLYKSFSLTCLNKAIDRSTMKRLVTILRYLWKPKEVKRREEEESMTR